MRLLIAKAELWKHGESAAKAMAAVIPYWDFWAYDPDEFDNKLHSRFGCNFDEGFRRFEKDIVLLLEQVKHGTK